MAAFRRTEAVKRRENIIVGIVVAGGIPLFLEWALYNSLWAWLGLKLYLVTGLLFGYIFFVRERASRREKWFWRAMLVLIPAHLAIMAIFLYVNIRWINVPIGPLVSYFILFLLTVVEGSYFLAVIDKSRLRGDPRAADKRHRSEIEG